MEKENIQPQTPNSEQDTRAYQAPQKTSSGNGALIAIVIILLVIVAGGLYFWLSQKTYAPTESMMEERQENSTAELEAQFNTNEFDDVDDDFNSVDSEFEGNAQTQ